MKKLLGFSVAVAFVGLTLGALVSSSATAGGCVGCVITGLDMNCQGVSGSGNTDCTKTCTVQLCYCYSSGLCEYVCVGDCGIVGPPPISNE
jgi:hypothetical protein